MPNRLLREGILSSERVNSLNWAEEIFYRRLMSVVDDFGRFYASPKLLRAACYPLHIDKVSDSDIGKWLTACVTAALVRVYPAPDGKRYLELLLFRQQVRAKASKFPAYAQHPPSTCAADAHLDGVVGVVGVVDDLAPTELVGSAAEKPYRPPNCPHEEIQKAYAQILPTLPQIAVMSDVRKGHMTARWREICCADHLDLDGGMAWFRDFFFVVAKSPFLTGNGKPSRDTGRVWAADFDWLMLPTNFLKVVEGRYQDRRAA